MQRPPQPLDTFDCGNFCGFVRTSDSILQRRMDPNTGVLPHFERQRSCAHGLDDKRVHRKILRVSSTPLETLVRFFWNWWQIISNVPLDLVLASCIHGHIDQYEYGSEISD